MNSSLSINEYGKLMKMYFRICRPKLIITFCKSILFKVFFANLFLFVHLGIPTLDQMLFCHCTVSLLKIHIDNRKNVYNNNSSQTNRGIFLNTCFKLYIVYLGASIYPKRFPFSTNENDKTTGKYALLLVSIMSE